MCTAGTLPVEWGREESLQTLSLLDTRYSGLSGPLPDTWGSQMSKLGALQSTDMALSGEVTHLLSFCCVLV